MTQNILNFHLKGNGPPLFLLHGLFASSRNWLSVISHFTSRYTVIVPDLRNHGHSFHSEQMDYERMADDILNLYNHLGISKAILIGHSMGGKTAMTLALKAPEKVHQLMVLDIAPATYRRDFALVFQALSELPVKEITSLQMAEDLLKEKIAEPNLRKFLLTNLDHQPDGHYNWRIHLPGIQNGMEAIRSFPTFQNVYKGYTIFLKGIDSHHISDKHRQKMLRLFPNSMVLTIANAGHNIHTDNKPSFLRATDSFLQMSPFPPEDIKTIGA